MKKVITYLLAAVMLFGVSACTWQKQDEENTEKLKNGDLIIMGGESGISMPVYDFDTFQPLATKSAVIAENMKIVYEPLFAFDSALRAVPSLAGGYVLSGDGTRITVSLKNNVLWHDGTPFTAEDVQYTVKCIKNNQTLYSKNAANISSCSVVGASTCEFVLKKPIPNAVGLLNFPIIKNGTPMTADAEYIPVGTGPYRYKEKQGANQTAFSVNEQWHEGQGKIGTITMKTLKDKTSAVYAFEANEVQCITSETLDLGKYTPKGQIQTADYISNELTFLGMNFYNSVLWGESTRQAIAYFLDKDEIVNSDMYGRAQAVDIPVNPAAWFSPERILKKDIQKAEQLLANDGWIKGSDGKYSRDFNGTRQIFTLNLLANAENTEKLSVANRIATALTDAGLSVNVKAVPYTEYVQQINEKKFDLFLGEIEMPGSMDPSILVSEGNYFTYVSGEMDALLNKMGAAQNDEQLKQQYEQLRDLFLKDMPCVPLFFRKGWLVYDANIKGDTQPNFYNAYKDVSSWYIYQQQK